MWRVAYIVAMVVLFMVGLATTPSTELVAVLCALILMGPLLLVDWNEK